jgi:hypothetical protein
MKKNKTAIKLLSLSTLLMLFINFAFMGSDVDTENNFSTSATSWNFFKREDGIQKFNFFGLLCPIKTSQSRLGDAQSKIILDAKVLCPKAPIEQIRKKPITGIEKKLQDSIKKLTRSESGLTISLHATASPDYLQYGLEKSLTPGHFETENQRIANARLMRAKDIFLLDGLQLMDSSASEIQLKDTAHVQYILKNKHLLSEMRYVHILISKERTMISSTWISLPYLLPFWLLMLYFLFSHIRTFSLGRNTNSTEVESHVEHAERPYLGDLSNTAHFSSDLSPAEKMILVGEPASKQRREYFMTTVYSKPSPRFTLQMLLFLMLMLMLMYSIFSYLFFYTRGGT